MLPVSSQDAAIQEGTNRNISCDEAGFMKFWKCCLPCDNIQGQP